MSIVLYFKKCELGLQYGFQGICYFQLIHDTTHFVYITAASFPYDGYKLVETLNKSVNLSRSIHSFVFYKTTQW